MTSHSTAEPEDASRRGAGHAGMVRGPMGAGALPTLLVIGAMKAGTASLCRYLNAHPEIQMSEPKELNFFVAEGDFDPSPYIADPGEQGLFGEYRTWGLGVDWYRSFFSADVPVRGEGSVVYSFPWYSGVVERIRSVVPDIRIVYLLRDPLERIISHYFWYRLRGREWRTLAEAISDPRNGYVPPSRYATVAQPFLEAFGTERVLLVRSEELRDDRRRVMRRLYEFLGVAEDFWSSQIETEYQSTRDERPPSALARVVRDGPLAAPWKRMPEGMRRPIRVSLDRLRPQVERPALDPAARGRLLAELEPEIAGIEELTGWDLSEWRGQP